MSKETAIINIRGAWVDTRTVINCFADAMKINLNVLNAYPERGESIADRCVNDYDVLIAEIRKERRKLVRARYELRKERENEKND